MSAVIDPFAQLSEARTIFSQVLVGVDGSPESFEAVRQAALLKAPGETMTCLSAWNLEPPLVTPMAGVTSSEADELEARHAAESALRGAEAYAPSAETMITRGFAAHALLDAIGHEGTTLAAIGSHGQGRTTGILLGSTATQLLHDAPCSILLARQTRTFHLAGSWSGSTDRPSRPPHTSRPATSSSDSTASSPSWSPRAAS